MKITTLLSFLIFLSTGLISQTFYRYGNESTSEYDCACYDGNGNMYAGYNTLDNDSFIFDRYNHQTKVWEKKVRTVNTNYEWDQFYTNKYQCTGIEDSIYLKVYRDYYMSYNRIYQLDANKSKQIAEIHGSSGLKIDAEMQVVQGRLHLVGDFDSIGNQTLGQHVYLNGAKWVSSNCPIPYANFLPAIMSYAMQDDSGVLISEVQNKQIIYIWTYPNNWDTLVLGRRFEKVYRFNNSFVFAKENLTDSLFYLSGSALIGRKMNKSVDAQYAMQTGSGVFFYNKVSKYFNPVEGEAFYWFQPSSGDVEPVYVNPLGYRIGLISDGTYAGMISSHGIVYGSKPFGNVAGLDLNNIKGFTYDTVSVKVFWDKDGDGLFNNADEYPLYSKIRNKTLGKTMEQNFSSQFIDMIPDYNNVDYELLDYRFSSCVSKKYQYTKRVTVNAGKSKYELLFPLSSGDNGKNVAVRGTGLKQARLDDTTEIHFDFQNTECDSITLIGDKVIIVLAKNTKLVSSTPAYTSFSGDTLTYEDFAVPGSGKTKIQLSLVYPSSKFSFGEKASHQISFSSIEDINNKDNQDSIVHVMVYSFDPNIKQSSPSGKVMHAIDRIRYHIQFQNEGNSEARTVTIKDTLDARFNLSDLTLIESSHVCSHTLSGNVLEFRFDNINLLPLSSDEEKSRGFVVFDIRLKQALAINESIYNKASIYFDENQAVVTPEAEVIRVPYVWVPKPLDLQAGFDKTINCRNVLFSNTSKNAKVYEWDFGDGVFSSQFSPQHIYYKNGPYDVTLIAGGYDSSISNMAYDTIKALVVINCTACEVQDNYTYIYDENICKKVHLSHGIKGDSIHVEWQYNNTTVLVNNTVLLFPDEGTYHLIRIGDYYSTVYHNRCKDTAEQDIDIICVPTSISDLNPIKPIKLYPNPFNDHLTIENTSDQSGVFEIYDAKGVLVSRGILNEYEVYQLNTERFISGIYLFILNGNAVGKWIKP